MSMSMECSIPIREEKGEIYFIQAIIVLATVYMGQRDLTSVGMPPNSGSLQWWCVLLPSLYTRYCAQR